MFTSFSTVDRREAGDAIDEEAWSPRTDRARKDWRTDRPPSPWESLEPLQAPPGVTALSGRVLRLDGRPLPDVTLEIDGHETRTDRTEIDATTANRGNKTYGFYEAPAPIKAGITNVLPYTIWSPVLDTANRVTIPSPTTSEVVVKTPAIPGLELHLPKGTVIRDEYGEIVRAITITPIPLDRTPFPLPSDALDEWV